MPDLLENWFFVSYAWADNVDEDEGSSTVSSFFGRLEDSLRPKVATAFARNGFLDRKQLNAGTNWEEQLTAALRGTRSFIPLLTLRYFSRESCAKEWAAFHARVRAHDRGSELVIPIIWDRPTRIKAPNGMQLALSESLVLPADVEYLKDYNKVGMSALLERFESDARARTTVKVVVDALTELIVNRYEEIKLPTANAALVPEWNELPTVFDHLAPTPAAAQPLTRLHFAVAAATLNEIGQRRPNALRFYPGRAHDWVPYDAAGLTIGQVVLETSRCFELPFAWLDVGTGLTTQIRQLEDQNCTPVVVLVDPWSLEVAALSAPLSNYDQQRFNNCVVVVAWNEEGLPDPIQARSTLEALVRKVFSRSMPQIGESAWFHTAVQDVDSLRKALLRAVKDIRALAAAQQAPVRSVASSGPPPVVRNS